MNLAHSLVGVGSKAKGRNSTIAVSSLVRRGLGLHLFGKQLATVHVGTADCCAEYMVSVPRRTGSPASSEQWSGCLSSHDASLQVLLWSSVEDSPSSF